MNTKDIAVLLTVLLAGCSTTPRYDARFGDAVREARIAMRVHPNGAPVSDPVVAGIDGQAAREAMNRYQETFKAPPPVVNVINIGGASGPTK